MGRHSPVAMVRYFLKMVVKISGVNMVLAISAEKSGGKAGS